MLITIGGVEAQSATVAAELQEVKAQQIIDESSMLQNSEDITLLKGTAADLTAKEEATDAKATTAQTTATDALGKLKTFITSQAAVDAALTATITGLSQTKADQKDTYSKGEMDAQQQLQDGRLDILEASNQTTGEVYKQRFDDIDENIIGITNRLTTDENTLNKNSMTIAGLSNAQMLMDTRIGAVDARTAPMIQQIQNIQSLDVSQNNRLAALENTDINIQSRCQAIETVNANQDVTISTLSGGVNGQITRVTALETLTNSWTPIMNCWGQPQDGWFQIQNDPTLHWDKITGFVQKTSLIINPKVDIYFGANNDYQPVPDRIILMSQKTIINPDRLLLHLYNSTLNKFEDKSIIQLFNEKIGSGDLTEIKTRVGVVESRCTQIEELNQNQQNNIASLQEFQASQIQTNLTNTTSINSLTNSVSSLSTDNTTNKTNIKTLQTQMTDVINVNYSQATLINNNMLQTGTGWLRQNNYQCCWGYVTTPSSSSSATVYFPVAFKTLSCEFVSVVAQIGNGGGGVDSCYIKSGLSSAVIRHDFTSSSKTGNYHAWKVEGTWQ
ncbi:Hypothetical_protein [Hexamita inflata]|uniref:Hypothetical_protein n=1 Tax=Hexamita inflata TaxID=28002 RepID=A0ABP1GWT7_9EUKA